MWVRIKNSLSSGIKRVKFLSSIIAERLKIEMSVIRLLDEQNDKQKGISEKMRIIGQRVLELKDSSEKNVFKDKTVIEAIAEIEKLNTDIEDIKNKVSSVSNITNNNQSA